MYLLENFTINKMLVNILDPSLSSPIISIEEMPINMESAEFFAKHIIRVLNDDRIKNCHFDDSNNLFLANLNSYVERKITLQEFAKESSEQLFSIMVQNPSILAGDLAFVSFYYGSCTHLAILKMSYQSTYLHTTDYENNQKVNSIIQNRTTLPNIGQRISEAVVVNLKTMDVLVLEKPVEMEGIRENYISKRFMRCNTSLSSRQQYAIVKNATDQIARKFFDEDNEKKMQMDQVLYEQLDDNGKIDLEKYSAQVFGNNDELKQIFLEAIERRGIAEHVINLSEQTVIRSFETKKIKTDNGIEIKIPIDMFNNPQNMELTMQPDGKISIILKNIGKIIS